LSGRAIVFLRVGLIEYSMALPTSAPSNSTRRGFAICWATPKNFAASWASVTQTDPPTPTVECSDQEPWSPALVRTR